MESSVLGSSAKTESYIKDLFIVSILYDMTCAVSCLVYIIIDAIEAMKIRKKILGIVSTHVNPNNKVLSRKKHFNENLKTRR